MGCSQRAIWMELIQEIQTVYADILSGSLATYSNRDSICTNNLKCLKMIVPTNVYINKNYSSKKSFEVCIAAKRNKLGILNLKTHAVETLEDNKVLG